MAYTMKILDPANLEKSILTAVAVLGIGAVLPVASVQADTSDETYEWSAGLVSFDEEANTLTVKARVEQYARIEGLDDYSEGDRLTLVWTGRSWAAGIRDIGRDPDVAAAALTLPVEFVGTETDGRYISFRVPVPNESIAKVKSLSPGDRVTAVSPKGNADWEAGVVSVRHYNDVS